MKTFFIEFSDLIPVSFLATRFVMDLLSGLSRYSITKSCAEDSFSCLI